MADKNRYYLGYNLNEKTKESIYQRAMRVARNEGIKALFIKQFNYILEESKKLGIKINLKLIHRHFKIYGSNIIKLKYYVNEYNSLYGERVIELALAFYFIDKYLGKDILELGNVINHYRPFDHVVIDKYEVFPKVINMDFLEYNSDKKFDLAISISTVEHIGFDEEPQIEGKAKEAIIKLVSLLKPKGVAVITVPLGYNPEIDDFIRKDKLFRKHFFIRISKWNTWTEATIDRALQFKYGQKYYAANAVSFLIYEKT